MRLRASWRKLMRLSVVLIALLLCEQSVLAEDWPQFVGPRRDGTSTDSKLAPSWPAAGPKRLWRKDAGAGFAGPVVVGKRLILFHRIGDQEIVESLDAGTGDSQWKFAYATQFIDDFGKGDGPRSTPCVAEGRVVTIGADGWLHCVELDTGRKVWGRALLSE